MPADTIPLIELFIKCAPSNREEKGASLIDQQWFMVFYTMVHKGVIDLRVTPVSLESPPHNYEQLNASRRLPAAWIESGSYKDKNLTGLVASTTDELETMMDMFEINDLQSVRISEETSKAEKSFEDVYINMMHFLKTGIEKPLLSALTCLNNFLRSGGRKYLLGNHLTYPDCLLMPKLQHLRVVLFSYYKWDIPAEFTFIWNYVQLMYKCQAFINSCPADRDILWHYNEKKPLPDKIQLLSMQSERLVLPHFRA